MALTLECIWNFKNQVVHQAKQVNQHSIHLAIKGLESRIVEQIQALESEEKEANCKTMKWTALSSGVINWIRRQQCSITQPPYQWMLEMIKGASWKHGRKLSQYLILLLQKQQHYFGFLQLAKVENYMKICIEGDSKALHWCTRWFYDWILVENWYFL